MPRYFTLAQAERMLPEVERALSDAVFHKAEYQKADRELDHEFHDAPPDAQFFGRDGRYRANCGAAFRESARFPTFGALLAAHQSC